MRYAGYPSTEHVGNWAEAVMSIGVILVLVAMFVVVGVMMRVVLIVRRGRRLRAPFGAEYDHVLQRLGSRRAADRELRRRQLAYADLPDSLLSWDDLQDYTESWDGVQAGFAADPAT